MKLLISELGAWSGYVSREFYHTMNALIADHGWKHIEAHLLQAQTGRIEAILREQFGELPSAILFWEAYHVFPTIFTDLLRMNCRKCVFMDDLHSFTALSRAMKELTVTYCDVVFSTYEYLLDDYFPSLRRLPKKIVWSPHAASPDFLLPYNEHPEDLVFLSGNLNDRYPLRLRAKALYDTGRYPMVYHPHPGYHCAFNYSHDRGIGRNYAAAMNRCRAAFTDCLTYRYVVAKYLEIPATGALLLAGAGVGDPLRALGFEENVHYIGLSDANLEEKVRYAVDPANRQQIDAIRKRGQALVWGRHTSAHRARLIDQACGE